MRSVSAGFSLAGAGAGATSDNRMSNTIKASIEDGSDIDATGAVTVHAEDMSDIDASMTAVTVSVTAALGAAVSIGIAVSIGSVDYSTQTTAQISASGVTAETGDVMVKAISTGTIDHAVVNVIVATTIDNNLPLLSSSSNNKFNMF